MKSTTSLARRILPLLSWLCLVGLACLLEQVHGFSLSFLQTTSFSRKSTTSLEAATTTASSSLPTWEELQKVLDEKTQEKNSPKEPLVTLFRDTNGWCPFCERVWLALEVKGIPYQETLINLRNKPEWFLQMVPTGLVPAVLIHSDQLVEENENVGKEDGNANVKPQRQLIWESLDILKALDEQFPNTPRLMNYDDPEYQKARDITSHTTTLGVQFLYGNRNGTLTQEELDAKKAAFVQGLEKLDAFLGTENGGPFCLGDTLSGVDIEMIPTMERWRYQLPLTSKINIMDYSHIAAWFDALEALPAYTNRVAGDAYSWTAMASTFLKYFQTTKDKEGNTVIAPEVQAKIDRADAAAQTLTSSFLTASVYEETAAAKLEAAIKLINNRAAIIKDCTNPDPQSQTDLPRASDAEAADAVLRKVAHMLMSDIDSDDYPALDGIDLEQATLAAQTVAARLCVPRDLGAPAAQCLRKTLIQACQGLRTQTEKEELAVAK